MMFSTAPSFFNRGQAPGLSDILNQNYGAGSGIQPTQNGGNINSMITNAEPPMMPQSAPQTQRNIGPINNPINTGPSRTIMGNRNYNLGMNSVPQNRTYGSSISNGKVRHIPFGGTNYDTLPGSISYQGPEYSNNVIQGSGGNNLWQTYNRMAGMSPNGNNLIY